MHFFCWEYDEPVRDVSRDRVCISSYGHDQNFVAILRRLLMADKVKRPHPRVSMTFELPSRTRQSETASTDLNAIVSRHRRAGISFPADKPYGDVTNMPKSRMDALEQIRLAREAFDGLPFKVRQAVNHDPRRLEEWIIGNPDLAREYGLTKPVAASPSSPAKQTSSADAEGGKKRKNSENSEAGEGA